MRPVLVTLAVVCVVAGVVAVNQLPENGGMKLTTESRNPWTHNQLNLQPGDFQFAVVSDRTGGHRAKIFSRAVERLNLLQPEFVVSVGDLIEGGNKTPKQLEAEWTEFDGYVKRLEMPFFYVPGNHDVGNKTTHKAWEDRLGRRYYHFLYRNVLFLCLNTDDPTGIGAPSIGKDQLAYAQKVLADNKNVRYTLVFLHKPIWTARDLAKRNWLAVEKALSDRPYTVFCGHVHRYRKFVRQGRNYYQLATTGGGSRLRGVSHGEFDHIVWITMKKDGPVLTNIQLDSVLPDDLKVPDSNEEGVKTKAKPKKTYPVRGSVYIDGSPVVGAAVVLNPKEGSTGVRGDAVTEGDGSFVPSTYGLNDGLAAGKYIVTIVLRRPLIAENGKAGPNQLPAKYANIKTSDLEVEIKEGGGKFVLDLKR